VCIVRFYLRQKASASIIADEPCTLFYLPAKKLEEMEKDAPEIASALHRFIAGILSELLIDTNDVLQALIHSLLFF
jgi:CRP-like cAMP-binding protein